MLFQEHCVNGEVFEPKDAATAAGVAASVAAVVVVVAASASRPATRDGNKLVTDDGLNGLPNPPFSSSPSSWPSLMTPWHGCCVDLLPRSVSVDKRLPRCRQAISTVFQRRLLASASTTAINVTRRSARRRLKARAAPTAAAAAAPAERRRSREAETSISASTRRGQILDRLAVLSTFNVRLKIVQHIILVICGSRERINASMVTVQQI
jgi:hypothetical protein